MVKILDGYDLKMKHILILSVLASGFVSKSYAGILIEPVLGYSFGNFKTVNSSGFLNDEVSKTNDPITGLNYGGRLGFQSFGLQLGIDYLGGRLTVDGEDKSKEKTKINEWGAFIGYKFPLFLRFYAGYIFGASFESEENKENKNLFGTGPKIGLGFSILPLVSLNLEWRNIKYEPSHKSEKIDDYVISYRVDSKYSALMVSLSIPLNL